ncbi:MAG TPA: LuxR C-terminal-related transcriptional regulator, partial [Chloroflexota bacterium]|nr:LuxR C-terminal-related transcriptional regulator [Chloroflexota bacterium]
LHEEGVALATAIGDRRLLASILRPLGMSLWMAGEPDEAAAVIQESVTLAREHGDLTAVSHGLRDLGIVMRSQQQYVQAQALFAEALDCARQAGYLPWVARAQYQLGRTAYLQGEYAVADGLLRESLGLAARIGVVAGFHGSAFLECLAALAGVRGHAERAARLFGAAAKRRAKVGYVHFAPEQAAYDREVAMVRDQLDPATFAAAWAEGQTMSAEQVIAYALESDGLAGSGDEIVLEETARFPTSRQEAAGALSPRETQVAALVTRGLTNREIAAELLITEHTVMRHVEHILSKLNLRSRTQIAAWAVGQGIVPGTPTD